MVIRLAVSLLPILLVTLFPGGDGLQLDPGERICLACGDRWAADAVLNALLFLPFGWVLGRKKGVWAAMGAGALLSGVLELIQLFLAGRYSSFLDVASNSVGAGIGAWAGTRERWPVRAAVAASWLALFAPGILFQPAPPAGTYYGQWTPEFGHMMSYRGQVLDATVGGSAVPSWRVRDTEPIRESLKRSEPITVRAVVGPPPPGPAPLFSIADDRQRMAFMMGVSGVDVFVQVRRVGTTLRFAEPRWWWPGAMEGLEEGDTLYAVFEVAPYGPCLSVQNTTRCLETGEDIGSWAFLVQDRLELGSIPAGKWVWALLLGTPLAFLGIAGSWKILLSLGTVTAVAALSYAIPHWVTPWTGLLLVFLGTVFATMKRGSG